MLEKGTREASCVFIKTLNTFTSARHQLKTAHCQPSQNPSRAVTPRTIIITTTTTTTLWDSCTRIAANQSQGVRTSHVTEWARAVFVT
jgi:hypothetical protein